LAGIGGSGTAVFLFGPWMTAARKRWEFLLTAAPLPIKGGTGSPLNPIATF